MLICWLKIVRMRYDDVDIICSIIYVIYLMLFNLFICYLFMYYIIFKIITFSYPLQLGSYVIYYLDYIIGRSWWVVVLYLMQCVVVIVVRGKPYNIMKDEIFLSPNAFLQSSIKSMLTFSWNIVLPTVLTVNL